MNYVLSTGKVTLTFWIIFIISPFFIRNVCALSTEIVPFGEVCIEVYVIALDGVDGHGVGNITRVVDAVIDASKPWRNATHCLIEPPPELVLGEVKINATVTVIRGWNEYEEVVKTCSRATIVNAHGETIPIPSGYTREEWIDKIAEAMLERRVTWVHTAGYPFYHIHHQESGISVWGEGGFKRLMSHIGKSNVTCHPRPPAKETDIVCVNQDAAYSIAHGWPKLLPLAFRASLGKPLNAIEFKEICEKIIWGTDDYYITGAIIKFAKESGTNSFGFYVHIGTYQTYTVEGYETAADYFTGYTGAGAAIWACAWRFAAENAISDAEEAIAKAESGGRTKGLDDANRLLQRAKDCIETKGISEIWRRPNANNYWGTAILRAKEARDAADNAIKPSFIEAYALPLAILGVVSAVTVTGLVARQGKNFKRERKENEMG